MHVRFNAAHLNKIVGFVGRMDPRMAPCEAEERFDDLDDVQEERFCQLIASICL